MKSFLSIILVLFSFGGYSQFTKQDFKEIGDALKQYKNIQGRYDKPNGILWIRRINGLNSLQETDFGSGKFYLYYGLKKINGEFIKTKMRIRMTYLGSDWLFIDEMSFSLLTLEEGDENLVQAFSMECGDVVRNTRSGGVEEICDEQLTKEAYDFFKQMTEIKRMTNVRLTGEKYIEKAMFGNKLSSNDELIKSYENEFKFQDIKLPNEDLETDVLTSEEALNKLKKAKEKLDLELITQEEYDEIKNELAKYIE